MNFKPVRGIMKVYGIKNCDTVKKARKFLDEAGVEYSFHDYKKDGVDADKLAKFVGDFGWEAVLNKRGTTWRRLDEATQEGVDRCKKRAGRHDRESIRH
jgi:arsenate reductase